MALRRDASVVVVAAAAAADAALSSVTHQ